MFTPLYQRTTSLLATVCFSIVSGPISLLHGIFQIPICDPAPLGKAKFVGPWAMTLMQELTKLLLVNGSTYGVTSFTLNHHYGDTREIGCRWCHHLWELRSLKLKVLQLCSLAISSVFLFQ